MNRIVVDSIEAIAIDNITYDLARESGFQRVDDLLSVARHGKGQNAYLIRFHYLPPGGWDVPAQAVTSEESPFQTVDDQEEAIVKPLLECDATQSDRDGRGRDVRRAATASVRPLLTTE